MNTFSFLIAFSAVLCGVFANPQVISGHYYGGNHGGYGYDHGHGHGHDLEHDHGYGHGHGHGQARVSAWVEPSAPCEGSSSGARVHVSTSSDYNSALRNDGGASYGSADIAPLASAPVATGSSGCSAGCPPTRTTYQQHPGFPQQNERGEIIIHRPAPIIVKRPPTKVLVNHPPLVVKPAPVVLHRPPPMVIKPVLVRHHPQPVKVEPVYVKVMKPATSERYVLEDKHNQGCGGNDGSYGNYEGSYGKSASLSAVDTGCN